MKKACRGDAHLTRHINLIQSHWRVRKDAQGYLHKSMLSEPQGILRWVVSTGQGIPCLQVRVCPVDVIINFSSKVR